MPPAKRSSAAPVPPAFPAVPEAGKAWTEAQRAQAITAYEQALEAGDPDAGRMRTLIAIHSSGDVSQHDSGPKQGVEFKAEGK